MKMDCNSKKSATINRILMQDNGDAGYRDYANEVDHGSTHTAAPLANTKQHLPFPVTLHLLLSELQQMGLDWIIGWCPHGRSVMVRNQNAFEKQILPLWSRQTKYSSFQRQLNLYGFMRFTHGEDKGAYYHAKFLRGKRFLACTINRNKIKGNGYRKASDPDSEPNFYAMSSLPASEVVPPMLDSNGSPLLQEVYPQLAREHKIAASPPRLGMSLSNVDEAQSLSISMAGLLKSMVGPGVFATATATARASFPHATSLSLDSLLHRGSLGMDTSIILPNHPINPFQIWNYLSLQAAQFDPRQATLLEVAEAVLKDWPVAHPHSVVTTTREDPNLVLDAAARLLAARANSNYTEKKTPLEVATAEAGLLGLSPGLLEKPSGHFSARQHFSIFEKKVRGNFSRKIKSHEFFVPEV